MAVFTVLHPGHYAYVYMLRASLYYDTCAPLLRHVRASTSTTMYVHVRDQNDNATYASTRWVPTARHFLACEDVAGEIRWPIQCVPAVRWRNNYFARNKEALPCYGRGPSCQPLHVQSTSDGRRSLTMLTTSRREHQGGGRRRGPKLEQPRDGEDAAVESLMERCGKLDWFRCAAALPPTGDWSKNRG